jgi:hypothetical protein
MDVTEVNVMVLTSFHWHRIMSSEQGSDASDFIIGEVILVLLRVLSDFQKGQYSMGLYLYLCENESMGT